MANEEKDEEVPDRDLTTPLLVLPAFKPHIAKEDVEDFSSRDKKLLLAFSEVAQKVDWLANTMIEENRYIRELEREVLKLRRWKQKIMIRYSAYVGAVVFLISLLSGTLGQVVKAIWSVIVGKSMP